MRSFVRQQLKDDSDPYKRHARGGARKYQKASFRILTN